MTNILFLVHRIPYPPNKGDKIRSYHFVKGLAESYQLHIAAFIDDPEDWDYVDKVKELSASTLFIKINPALAKIKSLSGLISKKPLTLPYYQNTQLQKWVDKTIQENNIEKIFIFSSAMAQYIQYYQNLDIIIDFVDVDSDKWLQYSQKTKWPMSWIYSREAKTLLEFDAKVARLSKKSIFVSQEESKLFQTLVDLDSDKISYVNNGVDIDYFSINEPYNTPYIENKNIIVFTGAMDYWANIDAVIWFVQEVFPKIRQSCLNAEFYIVGSKPAKAVTDLANVDGVFVTGRVEDIRPYLFFSNIVVAPLLIARGIQNKVLEAMAMGKAIIATPQAIEGINITNQTVYIEEKADKFSRQVITGLSDYQTPYCVEQNRDFVEKNFSWDASLKRLAQIIDE